MNPGLKVTYLYHDGDIIEVRIIAQNASFRGAADVYVGTGGLLEASAVLEGFPKDRSDTREVAFGAAGPESAGGSARLTFYCKDGAGHTAFLAEIEGDYGEQKRAQRHRSFAHSGNLTRSLKSRVLGKYDCQLLRMRRWDC